MTVRRRRRLSRRKSRRSFSLKSGVHGKNNLSVRPMRGGFRI